MAKPAKGWADDRGTLHATEREALMADLMIVIGGTGASTIVNEIVAKSGKLHPILKRIDQIKVNAERAAKYDSHAPLELAA